MKAHALLDVNKNIPVFIDITERKVGDSQAIDKIALEPGAFYIMDRAYLDWKRLYHINCSGAFFVLRTKKNTAIKRIYSNDVDKSTGVRSDQVVRTNAKNKTYQQKYSDKLRRISYFDSNTEQRLVFLTNNFYLPAKSIADLYKSRWQIELFFKWIKQNLRIKKFYGNSSNAVKIQIWIAITVYILVAIAKKRLQLPHSHYTILQVLSVTLLEKKPILQAFSEQHYNSDCQIEDNQLDLFTETVGQ